MAVSAELWPDEDVGVGLAWDLAKKEAARSGEVRAHTEYQTDPVGWIRDRLGVPEETLRWSLCEGYEGHEWDGTPDALAAVLEGLAEGVNVGVESATGTGKTFVGACIVLWFLACFEDSIVVTAAPKQDQLLKHIWKEIGRLWPRFQKLFPAANLTTGHIAMRPGADSKEQWAATAFVCGVGADEASATKAQGFHAEHMLIITEETPGIHRAIMVAFENTCTAPHNLRLAFGNPDSETDELHKFCTSPGVTHVRVSALDHPNVVTGDDRIVPGAVGRKAVERRRDLYAHLPGMFESRVRGIAPQRRVGAALKFVDADHLETWEHDVLVRTIQDQGWPLFGGIDFGWWRFAFVLLAADRAERAHVIDELFSQQEKLSTRAERIHETVAQYIDLSGRARVGLVGDSANPTDINEINAAFKKLRSPLRVTGVEMANKARATSVDRLNNLLGRRALLVRRDLGEGAEWFLGQSAASPGEPETGSRLLWEVNNWAYPPPRRDTEAQRQDPDDNTADGADAVAALRYAIMSWWKPAKHRKLTKAEKLGIKDPRQHDMAYHEMLERREKLQRRLRRQGRRA